VIQLYSTHPASAVAGECIFDYDSSFMMNSPALLTGSPIAAGRVVGSWPRKLKASGSSAFGRGGPERPRKRNVSLVFRMNLVCRDLSASNSETNALAELLGMSREPEVI
jgi:hypothetical protein